MSGISRSGSSGSYTYAVVGSANRPVNFVSYLDAMRFSNWVSNGQPTGAQGNTTTENGAYSVLGTTEFPYIFDGSNYVYISRNTTNPNTGAAPTTVMPTEDEWYKAAYYDPTPGAGGGDNYWLYPTQSDNVPGNVVGAGANQANYNSAGFTDVGAFTNSSSYYGTYDQGEMLTSGSIRRRTPFCSAFVGALCSLVTMLFVHRTCQRFKVRTNTILWVSAWPVPSPSRPLSVGSFWQERPGGWSGSGGKFAG